MSISKVKILSQSKFLQPLRSRILNFKNAVILQIGELPGSVFLQSLAI